MNNREKSNMNLTFRLKKGHSVKNTGKTRFKKGYTPWNKGKKMSVDFKEKCRKRQIGIFKRSKEGMISFKKKMSGINHPKYKIDRNTLAQNEKKHLDSKYKDWMLGVKNRDNYKCKICNITGRLEAHHILPWRDYPELRYDINNGITLCHAHHPRKRAEEKRLIPIFKELVSVSKVGLS